ncbi:hypothetical protein TBK1r_30190 [Stieleria magnilauensis]|uniref:Uncharacterized protein n=1 Tax=Stieleria magnilauensis TaxID=2527963 RepID=A0ABX5XQ04_9BACT|nr:hypothetical protein TBK1r_30190 [Planctomycetes bacterium TBK1r]
MRTVNPPIRIPATVLALFVVALLPGCGMTVTPLTTEETLILDSAAPNDSLIIWSKFDGVLVVDVDDNDLVPDQRPQTIDAWLGAIDSLESRGFITNDGLKIGCYILTDAGKAATSD